MPRPHVAQLAPDAQLVATIDEWIKSHGGNYRRLTSGELGRYPRRRLTTGWRLDVQFSDRVRQIDICLDEFFPHTAAQAFLTKPPKLLTWPHVQHDGLLCLLPGTAQVDLAQPIGNVAEVLAMAVSLVEELIVDGKQEDFRNEFDSYWTQTLKKHSTTILSLLSPQPPSRRIYLYRSRYYDLIGDNESDVVQWVRNRIGKNTFCPELASATFVWKSEPWLPAEYPQSAHAILSLVESVAPDSHQLIQQLLFEGLRQTTVVVGSPTANGPCLAAVTLYPPANKYRSVSLEKGFRPGKTPSGLMRARASTATISRSAVYRVDAEWIHGRGSNPYTSKLRTARVAIFGCGSIGAVVAITLAQAGVGGLILVDPDVLNAANMGRHPLGAEHLLESKVKALANHITQRFPHTRTLQALEQRSEDALRLPSNPLDGCTLIVSAMGNWGSESALNAWHLSTGRRIPIVYGWTEPFACAGHAVAITNRGGCFQCGMSTRGTPKLQVTKWLGETIKQEPGCGTLYQPYGPVELSHVNSMIAETAIEFLLGGVNMSMHRIWAGRRRLIEASGGSLTDEWEMIANGRTAGSFAEELEWPNEPGCQCAKASVA